MPSVRLPLYCPICELENPHIEKVQNRDAEAIECKRCGTFIIAGDLLRLKMHINPLTRQRDRLTEEDKELLPYLSAYTRQTSTSGGLPLLERNNWKKFTLTYKATSMPQKIEKLLQLIVNRSSYIGDQVSIEADFDYPMIDAVSADEFENFLDYLVRRNHIRCFRQVIYKYLVSITIEGREFLEQERSRMATPKEFLEIMTKFQRVLRTGDYSEVDEITLEDLKLAKAHLYADRNMEYYQILLDKINEKEEAKKVREVMVNISHSNVGLLNTGEIGDIQSINVSLSSISQRGDAEIVEALKDLTEAVTQDQTLNTQKRKELLELLDELSKQAALPEEKRSKTAILKATASGLASSMSAAGGLAEVWTTWGPAIKTFFGF